MYEDNRCHHCGQAPLEGSLGYRLTTAVSVGLGSKERRTFRFDSAECKREWRLLNDHEEGRVHVNGNQHGDVCFDCWEETQFAVMALRRYARA